MFESVQLFYMKMTTMRCHYLWKIDHPLDRKLFEYILQIPSNQLIGNGYGKNILRKALSGVVPNSILYQRRKIGFNATISEMIIQKRENRDFLLDDSQIFDFVSKKHLSSLIKKDKFSNMKVNFI